MSKQSQLTIPGNYISFFTGANNTFVVLTDNNNKITYNMNGTLVNTGLDYQGSLRIGNALVNNLFVIDYSGENKYVCGSTGCSSLYGDGFNPQVISWIDEFSNVNLENGQFSYPLQNTLNYQTLDTSTGNIATFSCNFNASGLVNSCVQIGQNIEPELNNQFNGTTLVLTSGKINNMYWSDSYTYGYVNNISITDFYNLYKYNGISNSWTVINPNYTSYVTSANNAQFDLSSVCSLGDNYQSIMTVRNQQSNRLDAYLSYQNSWSKLNSGPADSIYSI